MLICRRSTCVADATNHESIKFSVQQSHDCERPACTITLKLLINLIIYTCAFPLLRNSQSQIGTSFFFWFRRLLTFYTAAARLQHPGIHVGLGVGEELVSGQVRVVRRGDEVVAQGLLHVLIHLVVQRVEDVTRWTAHEICETWRKTQTYKTQIIWNQNRCLLEVSASCFHCVFVALGVGWAQISFVFSHASSRVLCVCWSVHHFGPD